MKGRTGIKMRRESAKKLLEAQLKKGTKPEKVDGKTTATQVPLTATDISRINREIETLNNRLNKVRV